MLPGMIPLGRNPGGTNAPRDGVDLDGATEYLQLNWSNFGGGAGIAPTSETSFTVAFWMAPRASNTCVISASDEYGSTFSVLTDTGGWLGIKFSDNKGRSAIYWTQPGTIALDGSTKYFVMVSVDLTASSIRMWLGTYRGSVSEYTNWDPGYSSNNLSGTETLYHGYGLAADYVGYDASSGYLFSGILGDVYWIDGQAIADPSQFVEAYGAGLKPVAYQGAYGNTGYHLDFADGSNMGHDISGHGFDFASSLGAPIQGPAIANTFSYAGNLTLIAGLSSCFDGSTDVMSGACAKSGNTANAWVGLNTIGGRPIFDAVVYGSNDHGFCKTYNPDVTLKLYGKQGAETPPVDYSDGVLLGSLTFTDQNVESGGRTIVSSDTANKYDHVWVIVNTAAAYNKFVAEVVFHEVALGPAIDAADRIVGWL